MQKQHKQDLITLSTKMNKSPNKTSDNNSTMIVNGKYSLWPGFSNQPSIWNLHKIKTKNLYFHEDSALFEQVFSLQYYQRGLRVVSLDRETTEHIGDDTSAYELNMVHKRYWDT